MKIEVLEFPKLEIGTHWGFSGVGPRIQKSKFCKSLQMAPKRIWITIWGPETRKQYIVHIKMVKKYENWGFGIPKIGNLAPLEICMCGPKGPKIEILQIAPIGSKTNLDHHVGSRNTKATYLPQKNGQKIWKLRFWNSQNWKLGPIGDLPVWAQGSKNRNFAKRSKWVQNESGSPC